MAVKYSWRKLRLVAAMCFIYTANAGMAQAQTTPVKSPEVQAQVFSIDDNDSAYYKQFIDKNGGYKDAKGGYFDTKAGTYTDEVGGVVDNWGGYTYKSGSYKSKLGDFYDAKENTFKLASGEVVPVDPGITPAQAIGFLRENVEQNGGFDKDLTRRSMMQQIKYDHPKPGGSLPPRAN